MKSRRLLVLIATVALGIGWVANSPTMAEVRERFDQLTQGQSKEPQDGAEGTYQPGRYGALPRVLRKVKTVPARPSPPGYDRECGTGRACSFGPAWTDDTTAPLERNGCDTRNDILDRDLRQVTYRPETHNCMVTSGLLRDRYTGQRIEFRKEAAYEVGVDHLYPLARAWDMGAHAWSLEKRERFANDPINLLAVDGRANSSKSDSGPGEWLPINKKYRCRYVARYLDIAMAYQLPITRTDHDAISGLASRCADVPNDR